MCKKILIFLFFMYNGALLAQKQKADSLIRLLETENTDTGRVKLMWQISGVMNIYDPESAVTYAQNALSRSNEIKYIDGQSKSLGALAIAFTKMGNYPKALKLKLEKLKLDEKRKNPRDLASIMLSVGVVYRYMEEYDKALKYYYLADSVITTFNLEELKYYLLMSLGDVYDMIGNNDSSFSYFNRSLILSNSLKNDDFIGNSMTGLGHSYRKQGKAPFSLIYYKTAIEYLKKVNNDDVLCEAALGLAELYRNSLHKNDSAVYYARLSLEIAEKDGFMDKQLEAADFLTTIYRSQNNVDSAYVYLSKTQQLNDSVNSKEKIRSLQLMSTNENLRQLEIAENLKIEKKERKQQLQLLFIGIFIPGFFLLTLFLSRRRVPVRIIKILGILSLLILFEYLTLFLHPSVAAFTNHTPIYEMFIFVAIAAILIPGHHRLEHWLIEKLTRKKGSIHLKKVNVKIKNPKAE